jgi:hypothetical protein
MSLSKYLALTAVVAGGNCYFIFTKSKSKYSYLYSWSRCLPFIKREQGYIVRYQKAHIRKTTLNFRWHLSWILLGLYILLSLCCQYERTLKGRWLNTR